VLLKTVQTIINCPCFRSRATHTDGFLLFFITYFCDLFTSPTDVVIIVVTVADTVRRSYLRLRRDTTRYFDDRRKSGIKITFRSASASVTDRTDFVAYRYLNHCRMAYDTSYIPQIYDYNDTATDVSQPRTWTTIFYSNEPA